MNKVEKVWERAHLWPVIRCSTVLLSTPYTVDLNNVILLRLWDCWRFRDAYPIPVDDGCGDCLA